MRAWTRVPTGLVALALIMCHYPSAATGATAHPSGSDQPAGKKCVAAEEARARSAGGDGGAPPKFSAAFYRHTFTINSSLDGLDGKDLPLAIEEICDVPRSLKKQAVQLAGTDGIARLLTRTSVWLGKTHLRGAAATNAVAGADTALLRARLAPPSSWGEDEDGNKLPTFQALRITITD
ncbi:MAG: hypothetical protein ACJ76V_06305 [Thermoleophilaceae bacterium]